MKTCKVEGCSEPRHQHRGICRRHHNEAERLRKRTSRYGVTPHDFDVLLADQGGCCALCHLRVDRLCIDHDHETGQVRALLCGPCNTLVGFAEHPRLAEALAYVEGHR